jgi:integrase
VNREMTVLKHMMSKALEWKLVTANPFQGVRSLRVPSRIERILGVDEESRLLACCDRLRSRFLRSVVVLALNTGMRRGELLSLKWEQVDLAQGRIRVLNAKTNSSTRSIPVNSIVHNLLSELSRNKKSQMVFPSSRRAGKGFLDLKKGFKKAVQLAGLPKIRFHDLRHTFATRLVQKNVDLITVQHLLGHVNISMTARYAHSPDSARIAAVKRLDELFSSQPVPKRSPESNSGSRVAEHKPQQVITLGP